MSLRVKEEDGTRGEHKLTHGRKNKSLPRRLWFMVRDFQHMSQLELTRDCQRRGNHGHCLNGVLENMSQAENNHRTQTQPP